MGRKRVRYESQACAVCASPTPPATPGWVILGDRRLVCDACYRAGAHRLTRKQDLENTGGDLPPWL